MRENQIIELDDYREDELAQDATSDRLPPGTTLLHGQYTITSFLNSGGFGITYRATDSLGRQVALKECYPSAFCMRIDSDVEARTDAYEKELLNIIDRFVSEAHSLANLKHKNIVHVHQIFEENSTAYMAMDYVDGPDLLDVVENNDVPLTPRQIERITRRMLPAIAYVHKSGMLHRDISPDNILIGPMGEPVLIDFGAAREHAQKSGAAYTRLKFVKDGYSPQEFYVSGAEQGPWSDLYSFAASMYHLVSGAPPEDGQKRLASLAAKEPDPYVPLAGNYEGYTEGFLEAIDKAMSSLPQDRTQSASEWMAMLAPLAASKPSAEADEPGSTNRNRFKVAAGFAAAAVIGGATLYSMSDSSVEYIQASDPDAAALSAGVSMPQVFGTPATNIAESPGLLTPGNTDPGLETRIAGLAPEFDETQSARGPLTIPSAPQRTRVEMAGDAPAMVAPDVDTSAIELFTSIDTPRASSGPRLANAEPGLSLVFQPGLFTMAALAAPTEFIDPVWPNSVVSPAPRSVLSLLDIPPTTGTGFVAPPDLPLRPEGFTPTAAKAPDGPTKLAALAPTNDGSPQFNGSDPLALAGPDTAFLSDTTPPKGVAGPVLSQQISASRWDVEMPFGGVVAQIRNAQTVTVADVVSDINLAVAGNWIREGVIIYTYNGETLQPNTDLAHHVLQHLTIDPDGYTRGTVRYRDPATGRIDRGLLAVKAVRTIKLADGTVVTARAEAGVWALTVTEASGDSGLVPGDVLLRETATGTDLTNHEELSRALDQLVAASRDAADFAVLRDGQEINVALPLARGRAG